MMKAAGIFRFLGEVIKIVVFSLLIVIPIRYFVFQPFVVRGESMTPNFHQNDYLLVDEISYRFREPHRGETIVFRFPRDPRQHYIKRIIGLPGETIEIKDGRVFVEKSGTTFELEEDYVSDGFGYNSERITLDNNNFFVLGDNRSASSDSRRWGPLPRTFITGRTLFRAWPLDAIGFIEVPVY